MTNTILNINTKEDMNQKNIIRRNLLDHDFRNVKPSANVINKLKDLITGKTVCTYIPIESEINILSALTGASSLNTTFMDGQLLQICQYDEPFKKNKHGVLEPEVPRLNFETEVFIVPGVGFTEAGDRLGRGGGHYDNLLQRNSELIKIGICHDFQIVKWLPIESHDVGMDYVFTNKNYYKSAI
ncbi:MAG: 5-formyltetrahydrofolate cyclo-ligase [Candidatus Actinomarinaceae bacterium]